MAITTCAASAPCPPWHNPGGSGKSEKCSFTLAIPEAGKDEQVFNTFIRCKCYGRSIEHALALRQGDTVLCEGKLSWSKGSGGKDKAQLAVTVWRILKIDDRSVNSEI